MTEAPEKWHAVKTLSMTILKRLKVMVLHSKEATSITLNMVMQSGRAVMGLPKRESGGKESFLLALV